MKLNWDDIDKLEDFYISYFLYKEGKKVYQIAKIRNKDIEEIKKDILKSKINIKNNKNEEKDMLIKIISMNKNDRLDYLDKLSFEDLEFLKKDLYKRYISFKSTDDRMILIWLIGELKLTEMLLFLKMELNSNLFNHKRLACSALGKIGDNRAKDWLEKMLNDSNAQVRQYAIKALQTTGDFHTIKKLENLRKHEKKKYVIREIDRTIEFLK